MLAVLISMKMCLSSIIQVTTLCLIKGIDVNLIKNTEVLLAINDTVSCWCSAQDTAIHAADAV